ncbi:MAG TPA: hypothetical protein VIC33_02805 [Vicinamibacterales bacterium]
MIAGDLPQALQAYAAGLDAEIALLRHLGRLADIQHAASAEPNFESINRLNDERERLMASLVRIEHDIKPLRHAIHQRQGEAARFPEFDRVVALHREASDQVARIMASDQRTMKALRDAELARRFAAQTLELGEATLAAYRRVVTPQVATAALVNKRG